MRFRKHILLLSILLVTNSLFARSDSLAYSFFIAGHAYGKPGVNNEGLHPAFTDKFAYIQSREEITFGVLLGDIVFPNPVAQDWDEVDADIATLGLPVFFAAGNHDMENRPLFESRYGATYYSFIYRNDLFIVLDPNIDGWNISGLQWTFLEQTVLNNYQLVDNIFVLFHQLLWWEIDNIYADVKPNSFAGMEGPINFWSDLEPLFHGLPNPVIICAGDLGAASWSSDFMYDTYDNISFVATGMGEGIGDNFAVINIGADKEVTYDLICLNEPVLNCFGDLTDYQMTGEKENGDDQVVTIFPNPTTGKCSMDFHNEIDKSIQLIAMNGHIVWEGQIVNQSKLTVDLSELTKGLYIVKTQDKHTVFTQKLLLQ